MDKQFPGKGKTLAQLSYGGQRTRATTQVIKPPHDKKQPDVVSGGKEEKKVAIQGRGVKIGGGIVAKKGEWRCKVCKFKNDLFDPETGNEIDVCKMCHDQKQVMKE